MGIRQKAKRYGTESCIHVRPVKEKGDGLSLARVIWIENVGATLIFFYVKFAIRAREGIA
jgi:hypothetical protein